MEVRVCILRTLMLKSSLFPRWRCHSYLVLALLYCVEMVFFSWQVGHSAFLFSLDSFSSPPPLLVHLQVGI